MEWTDAQRINAVKAGRWIATAPFTGRAGFHLNGLNTILGKKRAYKTYLHQFAANFLKAKSKGREAMVVWINTFLAETFQDDAERVNTNELLNRGEDYAPESIPNGVLVITAGADVQADRIEVLVDGWGFSEERWFLQYKVIPGNTLTDAPWNELDEFLKTTYRRADGLEFPITSACVDAGFSADQVLRWTKPRFVRRIYAVRGDNQRGVPIINKKSTRNRYNAPVFFIGTDVAKAMIHGRLKLTSGPNMIHWPNDEVLGFNLNFFDMLTAEEQVVRYVKGFARMEWVKIRDRNEALDCSVYSLAALNQLQPNWKSLLKLTQDRLRKLREEGKLPPIKPSEATEQAPPAPPPAAPAPAEKPKEEEEKPKADVRKVKLPKKKKGFSVKWSRW
jgi:phage terminase large subunit GpA-like protein